MSSSTPRKKSKTAAHGQKKSLQKKSASKISPELQRALTIASVAALKAFIESWDKESPETIPQPLRIMHEVMQQLGERHHG